MPRRAAVFTLVMMPDPRDVDVVEHLACLGSSANWSWARSSGC
jgi:hypothetical protein